VGKRQPKGLPLGAGPAQHPAPVTPLAPQPGLAEQESRARIARLEAETRKTELQTERVRLSPRRSPWMRPSELILVLAAVAGIASAVVQWNKSESASDHAKIALERAELERDKVTVAIDALKKERDAFESEKGQLKTEVGTLVSQRESVRRQLDDLQNSLTTQHNFDSLRKQLEHIKTSISAPVVSDPARLTVFDETHSFDLSEPCDSQGTCDHVNNFLHSIDVANRTCWKKFPVGAASWDGGRAVALFGSLAVYRFMPGQGLYPLTESFVIHESAPEIGNVRTADRLKLSRIVCLDNDFFHLSADNPIELARFVAVLETALASIRLYDYQSLQLFSATCANGSGTGEQRARAYCVLSNRFMNMKLALGRAWSGRCSPKQGAVESVLDSSFICTSVAIRLAEMIHSQPDDSPLGKELHRHCRDRLTAARKAWKNLFPDGFKKAWIAEAISTATGINTDCCGFVEASKDLPLDVFLDCSKYMPYPFPVFLVTVNNATPLEFPFVGPNEGVVGQLQLSDDISTDVGPGSPAWKADADSMGAFLAVVSPSPRELLSTK